MFSAFADPLDLFSEILALRNRGKPQAVELRTEVEKAQERRKAEVEIQESPKPEIVRNLGFHLLQNSGLLSLFGFKGLLEICWFFQGA